MAYNHITTSTTTLVDKGPGVLNLLAINTKGASSNTATIYDGLTASGTPIAIVDTTQNVGSILYEVPYLVGLTVVTATGTQADLTVSYN